MQPNCACWPSNQEWRSICAIMVSFQKLVNIKHAVKNEVKRQLDKSRQMDKSIADSSRSFEMSLLPLDELMKKFQLKKKMWI